MVGTFFSNFMAAVAGQSSDDRRNRGSPEIVAATMSRIRLMSTGKMDDQGMGG